MKRLAICLLVVCGQANGQRVIATIAGYGARGFGGDGGPATSAALGPGAIALDASGNLFVADPFNNRIRKISASGMITTIAGGNSNGTPPSLGYLTGVAVDASGNLFVADTSNLVIRKVSADGTISTVAGNGRPGFSGDGGSATTASLAFPNGVAVDGSGNLFIVDAGNNRIRKVSAGGIITTVAGNGAPTFSGDGGPAASGSLNFPAGVAVDTAGNLFIADANNNRVRKVSPGGIISTVAGNGNARFSGDGGPAASASLSRPTSVAVDASGNLFIADGNRIRMVSSAGSITTAAGNGTQGFSGDLGPATSASLNSPGGVAVDASGNLFIADTYNYRIRQVSTSLPAVAATFSVDPAAALGLFAPEGAPAQKQSLQIDGVAGASWQATAATSTGGAWLNLATATGQVPASLMVQVDSSSLMPGNYQGSITISAPGAIPPSITVTVMLFVFYIPPNAYQITNTASKFVSGQNGFGIAQGSLFAVSGNYLGPAVRQHASSFPIPLALAGTSIQIAMSGATYDAPMISTSYSEVSAVLPSLVPTGDGTLVVTYNGSATNPIPIHVVKSAFGISTVNANGAGAAVVHDVNHNLLTYAQPAHAGDTVKLWGTGLGPVNGAEAAGPLPGNLFTPEVFVGNQAAALQYAGRSGCCAGVDEIAFQIPPDVQGCFVPLAVRTGGAVSNFVNLPIAPAGEACSDPVGLSPDLVTKAASPSGVKIGGIALGPVPALQSAGFPFLEGLAERLSSMLGTRVTQQELLTIVRASRARRSRALQVVMKKYAPILKARKIDPAAIVSMANAFNYRGVSAGFQQANGTIDIASEFAAGFPPPGTCTAGFKSQYQQPAGPGSSASGQVNDAGPQLFFNGPAGAQTLTQLSGGAYQVALGSASTFPPGTYFVSSNGGNDVGPFTATLQVGPAITWTNKASVGFIDRSQPLTINWSGGPPAGYVVFGGAGSSVEGVKAGFVCVADVNSRTLTVPDFVLSVIPHTSHGSVFLGAHPLQNLFSAPGIDVGYFADLTNDSKSIGFQ